MREIKIYDFHCLVSYISRCPISIINNSSICLQKKNTSKEWDTIFRWIQLPYWLFKKFVEDTKIVNRL